jgi:hypothetical protein
MSTKNFFINCGISTLYRAKEISFVVARGDKRDLKRVCLGGGEKDRWRHTRQESFVPPFVTKI